MIQLRLWGLTPPTDPTGALMRRARVASGLSQPAVARALGVSQATVSRLESGSLTATLEDLLILANATHAPVSELLGTSPAMARRHRWDGRSLSVHASRRLAEGLPPGLVDEFISMGGSLRALRSAQAGDQPLTASQAAILLALGVSLAP